MTSAPVPIGNDILVNTYSWDYQFRPSIAALADGGFVVTWESHSQEGGSGWGIYGQRYDESGAPVGNEFHVNTYTPDHQAFPSVAALADGGFVVTWESSGQDGSAGGIYGQRYKAGGEAVGGEFRINSYTNNAQQLPSIAALSDGGFVVTWESWGQDGSGFGIYGQRYDASGVAVGGEFRANTHTSNAQQLTSVAALSDGGFVVTWTSTGQDGDRYGVFGQLYDAAGAKVGSEFRANTYTVQEQGYPSATGLEGGGFVVTWESNGQDGSGYGVYGQMFSASGGKVGGEFRVNTYTFDHQGAPSVASLSDGGFVVLWESASQDGSGYGIYGQRYDASGAAVGNEFRANDTTAGSQAKPEVVELADGRLVVSWHGAGTGGYDVFVRLFDVPGNGSDNTAPVVEVADQTLGLNNWAQPLNWITYSDDDDDAAVRYEFWDGGTDSSSARFWTADGYHAPNQAIAVEAADLGDFWVQGGSAVGSETMWVRAFDGTVWGSWATFTVTSVAGNTAPVVTVSNQTLSLNQWAQPNGWLTYFDAEGDAPVRYQFWDDGLAYGSARFWMPDGYQASNQAITVEAADLDDFWVQGGSAAGSETMWVRAFDGLAWGSWATFTVTSGVVNAAPMVVALDQVLGLDQWAQVQGWFAYSDLNGDAAQTYQFWDDGLGSDTARFWSDSGGYHAANQAITVQAADIGDLWARGGSSTGSETMWVRAFDGAAWSPWVAFNVTSGAQDGGEPGGSSGDIHVNGVSSGGYPAIAVLSNGGFVVTWEASGKDGSGFGVYGQRFDASGQAVGSEFRINTFTLDDQQAPSVAGLSDGGFVVTWESWAQDGGAYGVYGQRYNASGSAVGAEFQVNTYTNANQLSSAVTGLSGGGFVVAWESYGQDGSWYGIFGQRYTSSGDPIGGEFQINSYTMSDQRYPSIASLDDGGFVVAWSSSGQDGSGYGVYAQRYNATGVKVGGELMVNSFTVNDQMSSSVAALEQGGFVITWISPQDGSGYGVYGQRFNSSGVKVGGEFRANTHTVDSQWNPSVTALIDGGFVVTWESFGQDGNGGGIYGQRYDASGASIGDEFRVNEATAGHQTMPAVVGLADGGFAVAWAGLGVFARLFEGAGSGGGNSAPLVATLDQTVGLNQWAQVQDWFAYADLDGDAAQSYQFWDDGASETSARIWTSAGGYHGAGQVIAVQAADLADVWVRGGSAAGSETMWIRAFDGSDWSAWSAFTVTSEALA